MEVHLDPVGGIAGDMFVAALLHAFPEEQCGMLEAIGALHLPDLRGCRLEARHSHGLQGLHFAVELQGSPGEEPLPEECPDEPEDALSHRAHDAHHPLDDDNHDRHHHGSPSVPSPAGHEARHGHAHATWAEIRGLIGNAPLPAEIKDHALGIFTLLAQAEAKVHGIAEDQVGFHEVGATDSIVDIVGAAYLIAKLRPRRWTMSPLPLGLGRVQSAHGWLPVPAPATALLLEGFSVHQDGVAGERVTPTGAAIARYLGCQPPGPQVPRVLLRSGIGLGTKSLPGISNCLRALIFSDAPVTLDNGAAGTDRARGPAAAAGARDDGAPAPTENGGWPELNRRQLAVLEFEVDDQTPEDLAAGLDRLRSDAAVCDAVQQPAIGKRGRAAAHIRLLVRPAEVERVAQRCFQETSTIGLRYHFVEGFTLPRSAESISVAGRPIRVKVVARPGIGFSAKAEMEDLAQIEGGHLRRLEAGQLASSQAVEEARQRQGFARQEGATPATPIIELPHHDDHA